MAEIELKPCPFCGSSNVTLEVEYGSDCGYGFGGHTVICNNCGVQTIYYETKEEAIEAWNKRADDE